MPRACWESVVTLTLLGVWVADATQAQPAKSADPFAEPLALVAKAKSAYAKVSGYSCNLIKRERIDGELTPNHLVALTVRNQPFSVSMVWQEPKELVGQEVVFVEGKNGGKMRVRAAGLLGAVGFVSLATEDPRTRKTSKHSITEAGIGQLIEKTEKGWQGERKLKATEIRIGTFTYAKRRCTRVEMTHPKQIGKSFLHYRNVIFFDQETSLPIRVENYDWPEAEGKPAPLIESFSYVNVKLNARVPDEVFER